MAIVCALMSPWRQEVQGYLFSRPQPAQASHLNCPAGIRPRSRSAEFPGGGVTRA
jgi:hypothetical protein